jgi:hypothetical protein
VSNSKLQLKLEVAFFTYTNQTTEMAVEGVKKIQAKFPEQLHWVLENKQKLYLDLKFEVIFPNL